MRVRLHQSVDADSSVKVVETRPLIPHTTIAAIAIAMLVGVLAALIGVSVVRALIALGQPTSHFVGLLVTGVLAGVITPMLIRRYSNRQQMH